MALRAAEPNGPLCARLTADASEVLGVILDETAHELCAGSLGRGTRFCRRIKLVRFADSSGHLMARQVLVGVPANRSSNQTDRDRVESLGYGDRHGQAS